MLPNAMGGPPPPVVEQAKRFIELNRGSLLEYWEGNIDTDVLERLVKP